MEQLRILGDRRPPIPGLVTAMCVPFAAVR
jgi:hypothetical protein